MSGKEAKDRSSKDTQNVQWAQKILSFINDSSSLGLFSSFLILFEIILNYLIIKYVQYTEIDWSTYQQQIRIFQNGERDYMKIEGDTGPIVYPAGYLYIFSFLNQITNDGMDIKLAQYIFAGVYLIVTLTVFAIYSSASKDSKVSSRVPGYILLFLCLSKRIHSIFALRLFNDCISMALFYVSLFLMTKHRWAVACLFYSAAVSVKMNLLLFAPALLVLLLMSLGIKGTIYRLAICAGVQALVAAPFMLEHPLSYLIRAFEFSRQFMYKWTVNWRFVSEEVFLSKSWALGLLLIHVTVLILFAIKWIGKDGAKSIRKNLSPYYIVWVMFTCNLIGITFSRSLHYQFYLWYFHSLPFLLWSTNIPLLVKFAMLIITEYSWNTYPSTPLSSLLLFLVNLILLISLYLSPTPQWNLLEKEKSFKQKQH